MRLKKMQHSRLVKLGIYYLLFIALTTAFFLRAAGFQEIVIRAGESKPYSSIFVEGLRDGFSPRGLMSEKEAQTTVLFFGDSNMDLPLGKECFQMAPLLETALSEKDDSLRPIVSKFQYPSADIFDFYCIFSLTLKDPPDLYVVPINWRSFSRMWYEAQGFHNPELSGFIPMSQRLPEGQPDPLQYWRISPIMRL